MKQIVLHFIFPLLLLSLALAQAPGNGVETAQPLEKPAAFTPTSLKEPGATYSSKGCPTFEALNKFVCGFCIKAWNEFTSSKPSWQVWSIFDSGLKALGTVLAAFLGAGWAARLAYRKWLEEHLTDKWYEIIKLGLDNPEFMNEEKTQCYKESFKNDDAPKYEMFARTCVAFVDHMVNARVADITPPNGIYCGTGRLLAGRHRVWVNDNLRGYNITFQDWFQKQLKDMPLPTNPDAPKQTTNSDTIKDHKAP